MKILVLGAGVVGLTTAIELARQGHDVEIWTKERTPHTTSDVAAAFWFPYAARPIEKVKRWSLASLHVFRQLAALPSTGIVKKRLVDYSEDRVETPDWASIAEDYQESAAALPPGFCDSFSFTTFLVDMTLYMPYLMRTCAQSGINIRQHAVENLRNIDSDCQITVNCTGLGSRELCDDNDLVGVKGQVLRAKLVNENLDAILLCELDHIKFGMIVPRTNDMVLGGTYEENFSNDGFDPKEIERIIKDCGRLSAGLTDIEIIGTASGLRPVRSSVRLECEKLGPDKHVIHNYGHGGAGVTLSWGCAVEVSELVSRISHAG